MKQCMCHIFYFLSLVNIMIPLSSFNTFLFLGMDLKAEYFLFQYHLGKASLSEDNAFAFLKADSPGDYITFSGFCQALCQVLVSFRKSLEPLKPLREFGH